MNKIKIDQEKFDEKLYKTAEKLHPVKKHLKTMAGAVVGVGVTVGAKVLKDKYFKG